MTEHINETAPLTDSITEETIIATETGDFHTVTNIEPGIHSQSLGDESGERVTIRNISSGDTQTFLYPDEDPLDIPTAQIIPDHVVSSPETILREYAEHHLSNDISVLGRRHTHSIGGSVGAIEYAIRAAHSDTFPQTPES